MGAIFLFTSGECFHDIPDSRTTNRSVSIHCVGESGGEAGCAPSHDLAFSARRGAVPCGVDEACQEPHVGGDGIATLARDDVLLFRTDSGLRVDLELFLPDQEAAPFGW